MAQIGGEPEELASDEQENGGEEAEEGAGDVPGPGSGE